MIFASWKFLHWFLYRCIVWDVPEPNQLWETKAHRTFAKRSVFLACDCVQTHYCNPLPRTRTRKSVCERECVVCIVFRSIWHVSLAPVHTKWWWLQAISFFPLFSSSPFSSSLSISLSVPCVCVFNDIYAPNGNRKLYLYFNGEMIHPFTLRLDLLHVSAWLCVGRVHQVTQFENRPFVLRSEFSHCTLPRSTQLHNDELGLSSSILFNKFMKMAHECSIRFNFNRRSHTKWAPLQS